MRIGAATRNAVEVHSDVAETVVARRSADLGLDAAICAKRFIDRAERHSDRAGALCRRSQTNEEQRLLPEILVSSNLPRVSGTKRCRL